MSQQPAAGFAGLLRRLRTGAGMTQDELAAASGVSTRTISDLERAVNLTARKDTAGMLADALSLNGYERERFVAVARGKPAAVSGPQAETDASNVAWIESAASPAFVSRERELGVLREAWTHAKAGHRVLALVGGEPGIGKTALTAELAREVHADRGLVLYGRWDEHVPAPYQAFREALTDYARACPEAVLRQDLADVAGEIARLYPVPAQRIGVSAAPPLAAAGAERFRLFEALEEWIARMATRRPVLLVLDDLQWADQSSLLLLPHLMRARRSTPLLAVAMYRDTGLDPDGFSAALPSLTRDIDSRRVALRGLGHDDVVALLGTVLPAPDESPTSTPIPAIAEELERETAGNPFFLLEMARHLSEGGAFDAEPPSPGQAPADTVLATSAPADIPESVREMVRSRLRKLSPACAEVLAIASLIGERFDAALLAAAASLDDSVTIALLEEAERAGLIAELDEDADLTASTGLAASTGLMPSTGLIASTGLTSAGLAGSMGLTGGTGEPDYWKFSHSLTRRVTAEELSRSRRTRLHHRIGETLESRPDVPPAQLAHHFGAAAKSAAEKAVEYERLAGDRALKEVAAEVAVRHFRRALQLLDRFGSGHMTLRCELLLELAVAHDRAGEYTARDERFAEAADTARILGNTGLFLRAALGYGGTLPATVDLDLAAQALLEEALDRLGEEDRAARAMVLARLAHWLHTARPYGERLALSDQSVALARGTGDRRTLATVLLHRCFALDGPDDVTGALGVADEILAIGDELSDPELTLEGLRTRLTAQFESGEYAAAVATARGMRRLAERMRHPEFIRLAAMWDVTVASLEGRYADAGRLAGELDRRLARLGHPQAQIIPIAQTFSRRWLQGDAAGYVPIFEALCASDPASDAWPAVMALCLAESGAGSRAAGLLATMEPATAAEADKNYFWWAMVVSLADAIDLTGDRKWAQALYDLIAPYAGNNATMGVASFLGAADHWLGVLAGVAGRFDDAIAHLETALGRHRVMRSRPWTALTQEACATVLDIRGQAADKERAGTLRQEAMHTAAELGLAAITRRPTLRG